VSLASAATLYTLNVNGPGNLLRVDTTTGAATSVAPELSLGPGSWNGLSTWPSDSSVLVAVNNPRPATFDDPQFSRLSRIDAATGAATLLPLFDGSVLGSEQVFSSALAISPLAPNVAVVIGADRSFPPQSLIWTADVDTGAVLTAAQPLSTRIESLTFAPDGVTLFGADQQGQLVNIDPNTAEVTLVGDPGLSNFITGLAFRPGDGTLFAIDGGSSDRLVILNPLDGSVVANVGPLGIIGPEGLAFIPEPSSLVGLAFGVLLLGAARRPRR
jgi:WD40 repeat protein